MKTIDELMFIVEDFFSEWRNFDVNPSEFKLAIGLKTGRIYTLYQTHFTMDVMALTKNEHKYDPDYVYFKLPNEFNSHSLNQRYRFYKLRCSDPKGSLLSREKFFDQYCKFSLDYDLYSSFEEILSEKLALRKK